MELAQRTWTTGSYMDGQDRQDGEKLQDALIGPDNILLMLLIHVNSRSPRIVSPRKFLSILPIHVSYRRPWKSRLGSQPQKDFCSSVLFVEASSELKDE